MSGSSSKCCKTNNDNGHSFLTHSFLLKGEELPMCIGCDKRENHFTAKSLRVLFKDISPEKIFNFLK